MRSKFEPYLPAIFGVLGTVLGAVIALTSAGFVESRKQYETHKVEAVAAYLQSSWGGPSNAGQLELLRTISLLSVYAPREVLEIVDSYQATDCASSGDQTQECKEKWAEVVIKLRSMVNADAVVPELVTRVLWGA